MGPSQIRWQCLTVLIPMTIEHEPTKTWNYLGGDDSLDLRAYTLEHFLPHSEVFFRALFSVMAEMQAQRGVASRT